MYTLVVLLALGVASATYINEHRPDEGAEWSDVNHFFFGIATKYGYPAEHRNVTTEDGYILALHRIPYGRMCRGKSKGPVILMHGIALPGLSWIMSGTKKSLGFILADSCYDVWVPETRGVGQSDRHTHLHPDDPKYWDFSFHEKGLYDLKAIFDYILDETKASHLNYVGYDVGTTYLLVFLSLRPEYNKRVNGAYLLAPEAFQAPPKLPAFIFGSLSDLFLEKPHFDVVNLTRVIYHVF
ncbi:UNVERIFIED_CONTAM: hypothetical protein PYX00_006411 [Menopon gallinae]|uniref:Partial AB-hydrolase lipase domain-containing protein n=1 Tax=Menopon gallinae TaxID=328185 RepID=A0AAW2HWE2_9NEOP